MAIAKISNPEKNRLIFQGEWTLLNIDEQYLTQRIQSLKPTFTSPMIFDAHHIAMMDTYGVFLLHQWAQELANAGVTVKIEGLEKKYQKLLEDIEKKIKKIKKIPQPKIYKGLAWLGKKFLTQVHEVVSYLRFVGQNFINGLKSLFHPRLFRFSSTASIIENTGVRALGIIALLAFMIGIVLTYQIGFQLKRYGATVYVIDLLGLTVLREFAPLLTAVMVAGRSGSAFTAQLGMMKIKEEIDALNTMGVPPSNLLILPRIFGLTLTLPLLTVWADCFGLLGGMVMSHNMLHIGYTDFLRRFPQIAQLPSFIIGIGKAPVFALIISSIACFQGLRVHGSADSVGKQTTRSVVQAIFFIIVADALFSILFSKLKI